MQEFLDNGLKRLMIGVYVCFSTKGLLVEMFERETLPCPRELDWCTRETSLLASVLHQGQGSRQHTGCQFHSWIIMRQQRCNCDKFLQLAHPSLLLISQLPMAVSRHIGPMMLERPGSQPTYWPHDVGAFRETADILAP